jgi:hypothetical protein
MIIEFDSFDVKTLSEYKPIEAGQQMKGQENGNVVCRRYGVGSRGKRL